LNRKTTLLGIIMGALIALLPGVAHAVTRDLADLQPARLTFRRSVLNQLTFGTYRVPFDELQTRPYNLLFTNIGRHPNLSPWQGQEGSYRRYLNALIGNNGVSNVDNDADSLQGSWIYRQSNSISWGLSAAFLAGSNGSDDLAGSTALTEVDDLSGVDLRGSAGFQLSERMAFGAGVRVVQANTEETDRDFETGVGGTVGTDAFDEVTLSVDAGIRHFLNTSSSWEVRVVGGFGTFEQDMFSEALDGTGVVTDRFVVTDYDVSDTSLGIFAGYNRLRREKMGETEFTLGLERSQRELDNTDLGFSESGGVPTPTVTLLEQDPITTTRLQLGARTVFQAGHTQMYAGGELGFGSASGSTQVDALGVIVNEEIDDSWTSLGVILGLRQPLFQDKLRFVVSGRADLVNLDTVTAFDTAVDGDDVSQTISQFAIGLEGVLANVVFDLAWVTGEEEPTIPGPIGLPEGSRRIVELNRLIVSAAVSW